MKNETRDLIGILKQNNEDFEWYPTSDEMLHCVLSNLRSRFDCQRFSLLDIGAGRCAIKNYLQKNDINFDYYAIEKSQELIRRFDDDVICLGCDFNYTTLIDKKCDVYFCNPPYSVFEQWVERILREGSYQYAYFVIPNRWSESELIKNTIEKCNLDYSILGDFDFSNAERQARAKVQVVMFSKKNKYNSEKDDAFDRWFNEIFKMEDAVIDEYKVEKEEQEQLKNTLVNCQDKGSSLAFFYNQELTELSNSFKTITSIPANILKDIGVNKKVVCEALKTKLQGLKRKYWKEVFDNLDEITSRLTVSSRQKLFNKFEKIHQVDFCIENIYSVVIWVIKNANKYYEEQLVELFKEFSEKENVKPYKSNQKLFTNDDWRWRATERSHYTLDYRMVVSKYGWVSHYSWDNGFDSRKIYAEISDVMVIARNLGFMCEDVITTPDEYGKKYYIYKKDGKPLFEYKVYKNGNVHFKFDIEFAKAFNVEASRILGWVRTKQDIINEFDDSLSGCEKYFNVNVNKRIENSNMLLLK